MDRLKLDLSGGMPLNLDDLHFEASALRSALSDIVKSLYPGNLAVVLHGCELNQTPTGISVGAGAIFYNDEIWPVAQHHLTVPLPLPDEPMWVFSSQPGPHGTKTFFNGEVHNVHELRRCMMKLSGDDGAIAAIPVSLVPYAGKLNRKEVRLYPIAANGVNDLSNISKRSYALKVGEIMQLFLGYSFHLFGSEPLHLTTLPSSLRPPYLSEHLVNGFQPTYYQQPNVPILLKFHSDGKITAQRIIPQQGLSEVVLQATIILIL
ncbi:MAG: hypothetical protein IPM52_13145 [Bacteroidetes bacterium]|nr:hypothetical protein [Bacteroidota bacterium]